MKIYLTSDTHFGHEQIKKFCGRPENFEELILKNLERVLTPESVLVHLGDFNIGEDDKWHTEFNRRITCRKWFVRGNHDHKSNSWYLSRGWNWVGYTMYDKYFGKKVAFSHQPLPYNGDLDLNIHGHFHNTLHRLQEGRFISDQERIRNEVDLKNLTSRHRLISIEKEDLNFQPVLLEHIVT